MDRPGVRQVPEGGGEQGKMEKTGCKIICGAPTTLRGEGIGDDDDDDSWCRLVSWSSVTHAWTGALT